jgi:D-alanine-D-alanine ligase
MGGASAEREISLSTGRQIVAALDTDKYDVIAMDTATLQISGSPVDRAVDGEGQKESQGPTDARLAIRNEIAPVSFGALADKLNPQRPDVAFLALHGPGGEDGSIQGFLEVLGIPYTGSGVLASALCMDKAMAKTVLQANGIPTPKSVVFRAGQSRLDSAAEEEVARISGFPCIVKPNSQGSTIGCTIVRSPEALLPAIEVALRFDTIALVEEFVEGVEITVGLLGDNEPRALPIIEIVAKGGFYDYEAKYATGGSEHIIPARLSPEAEKKVTDYAIRSHIALGCRGMSRVDMMIRNDEPTVLEVNTIPGMTPTSLLPDAARAAGIAFSELLDQLIASAMKR